MENARVTTLHDLDTPALVVDLDALESNIAEMAEVARTAEVRLRPHTKTHKCPAIARMQVDAGASGITVAKLGEAEVMADAGFDDILVAYPIFGAAKLARLRALMRASVRVTTDSVEVAEGLGSIGRDLGRDVPVLVEVDTGLHRLGRPPGEPTVELVSEISRIQGVEVLGLLTHAGHAYASADALALRAIAEREGQALVATTELCERAGIPLREISVGSTPTARIVAGVAGVTEVRPGTYVFNDGNMVGLGVASEATCAASVLATVISRPAPDRFVIDAGTKSLAADGGGLGAIRGRPGLSLEFLSEEHGVGRCSGGEDVAIGDRVEVIPVHICPCVNLFDVAYGVRGGEVVEELEIAGRGKVR